MEAMTPQPPVTERFAILFDAVDCESPAMDNFVLTNSDELQEIAELRRLCAVLAEPEARFFTGT